MSEKRCPACGVVKNINLFSPNRTHSSDGLQAECKACNELRRKHALESRRSRAPTKHKNPGDAEFWSIVQVYTRKCRVKGYEWTLTEAFCRRVFKEACFYCGREPAQARVLPHSKTPYLYNGLDRVNNAIGYRHTNVVPACGTCNNAKSGMTLPEFYTWITNVCSKLAG